MRHNERRMPETVLVLGSGPIRIGQGIEFDYSCVHCVWALEKLGYRAIILNNNPETVSTDFDTGDGLYFEPVTLSDVRKVVEHEDVMGVVCQFGGQTAINLAEGLAQHGIPVLGTSHEAIGRAEDRSQFDDMLEKLGIARPRGKGVHSIDEAIEVAREVGYPVLVRPSFVLGGRAMEICYNEEMLRTFYAEAEQANEGQPVLVDQYLLGKEAEVDVISDGVDTLLPGIMEHIERAGVHSGDSMAVYPPISLSVDVQAQMCLAASKIARELKIKGLMNIQFVIVDSPNGPVATVLEVNPRASRTVPYLSKITGIPMVDLATHCMMGRTLAEAGYGSGLWKLIPSEQEKAHGELIPEAVLARGDISRPEPVLYAVKAPVFSFQKLRLVEPSLGPEMKSTGEIMGVDFTYEAALYKALIASGLTFKKSGSVLLSVQDADKPTAIAMARELTSQGYTILATSGTLDALKDAGVEAKWVMKIHEGEPNLLDSIHAGEVSLMINTPSQNAVAEKEAALIRRACIETGVACITSIDTAQALVKALPYFADPSQTSCCRLEEYFAGSPRSANVR